MANLTRIYAHIDDVGNTRLSDNAEVPKTDLWVGAYGAIGKTNSNLTLVVAYGGLPEQVVGMLALIRNELFNVGADLSTPPYPSPQYPLPRVEQSSVDRLEEWCNEFGAGLPSLCSFILPGDSPVMVQLHVARTVCRRAKRTAWWAAQIHGTEPPAERGEGGVNLLAITYLNRLGDLLFNMCRTVTGPEGDVLWIPGMDRQSPEERRNRTER